MNRTVKSFTTFFTKKLMASAAAVIVCLAGMTGATTHTWDGDGADLTLSDGDEVVIATGASGELTIPANATVTITGGTGGGGS